MIIVVHTQYKENYGAHDWDGKGECPQYWKFKGGSTYFVTDVSVEQAQSPAFWDSIHEAIELRDYYQEEYIVSSELVDQADFVESTFIEEWDSAKYLRLVDGRFRATETQVNGYMSGMRKEIAKVHKAWWQVNGQSEEFQSSIEFVDGKILPYGEGCERLASMSEAA